jgi:hypothetical protein
MICTPQREERKVQGFDKEAWEKETTQETQM